MLERSVKLVDKLLSCDGVTAFTTTGLSESEAQKYISLPKKYDVVFTRTSNSSYSVHVSPKITPLGVVQDLNLERFINRVLPVLVKNINDLCGTYSYKEKRSDYAIKSVFNFMSMNVNKDVSQQIVNKYSLGMNSLSPFVLEYIIDRANKFKVPIALTTNEVRSFLKAGVRHA